MQFQTESEQPAQMAAWQAQFVKGGTKHGFTNTGYLARDDRGDLREEVTTKTRRHEDTKARAWEFSAWR